MRLKSIGDDTTRAQTVDVPLVSVVTVVRNAVDSLESTIQSVINQTYKNIEYIIIDGQSTDGTLDMIKKYGGVIGHWASEPDDGIYDAMNKGISVAKGDWIIFMNAGDGFYDKYAIEQVIPLCMDNVDIIYGRCEIRLDPQHKWILECRELKDLWKGIICSHQSLLVRTAILKRMKFSTKYKMASDYDFLVRASQEGCRLINTRNIISFVAAYGLSDTNRIAATRECWEISKKMKPSALVDIYYLYATINILIRRVAEKILPNILVKKITTIRHKVIANEN